MYRKSVFVALILVYLVIIAGAVVRMTGSGMGCPDWPKCFGYIIPPTQESELLWQADKDFKEGQVIIVDKTLQIAAQDFKTGNSFNAANWEPYDKHDYAIFNPWHTWIEYINRLLGALAGIAVFIMAILSIKHFKRNRTITWLSWLSVFLMGFQGWLGATVVYSVLAPVRITLHMVVALIIVAVLIYLLYLSRKRNLSAPYDALFKWGMVLALVLTLVQIILGTQVRQFVDEQVTAVGYDAKSLWLNNPEWEFYVHRTFSIVVFLINAFLFYRNRSLRLRHALINWVMLLLGIEILTGIAMFYLDFPFLTQPAHLIIASILFGIQFYLILLSKQEKSSSRLGTAR